MKALILKSKKSIISIVDDESELVGSARGKYDHPDGKGGTLAVLVDVPEGFQRDELIVNNDLTVSGDRDKRAARLARESAKESRKELIRGLKSKNSVAALREVVQAMAEDLGYELE